jgi:capsular polysaccharide biosynthesis protein
MEPEGYFRTFAKRWFAILLCALIGIAVSAGVARAITPEYAASATLFLKVESAGASLYERSQFGLARIQSYPELVNSPELLSAVIKKLNLKMTQQQLSADISAENPTSTVLLQVTAVSADPDTAAAIANAAADQLASTVNTLENSSSTKATSSVTLNLTLPAEAPTTPQSPKVPIILGLGLIVGLAVGLIAALLLGRFDTRLKSAADIRRFSGLPLIGQLPLRLSREWNFPGGEAPPQVLRSLEETTANIRAIYAGKFPAILAIVPVGKSPSKAGTRVGLARALASTGRRVLLVETATDAQASSGLAIPAETAGFTEVLAGSRSLTSAVTKSDAESFEVLPVGQPFGARTTFAAEKRADAVFDEFAGQYDVTLLQVSQDGEPIGLDVVAPSLHSAILVVTYARTNSHRLNGQIARMRALGIEPVGVIMTAVPQWRRAQLLESWEPGDIVMFEPPTEDSAETGEAEQVLVHRPTIRVAKTPSKISATQRQQEIESAE